MLCSKLNIATRKQGRLHRSSAFQPLDPGGEPVAWAGAKKISKPDHGEDKDIPLFLVAYRMVGDPRASTHPKPQETED